MQQALNEFLGIFKNSRFRNLWCAQVISQTALNMLVFVLGVIVYESSKSNTAVSLLYLFFSLPAAVFGVISGVFVDRMEKKQLLIITTVARSILIFLMLIFMRPISIVYILLIIVSIISQFFIPAEATLIPQYVEPKHLVAANTLFTLTFYLAALGGFVLAGPIYGILGSELVLLFLSMLFIVSTLFLLFIPKSAQQQSHTKIRTIFSDIFEMLAFMRKNVRVATAVILMTTTQTVIAIMATLAPGFADKILTRAVSEASVIILGPAAIGMIVGALVTPQLTKRFRKRLMIESSILGSGLLLSLIAIIIFLSSTPSLALWILSTLGIRLSTLILPIALISFFSLGFVNSIIDVLCNHTMQSETPSHLRGKIYGLLASLIGGVALLPVVVSGVIADLFGIPTIIGILGVLLIVFTILGRNRINTMYRNAKG